MKAKIVKLKPYTNDEEAVLLEYEDKQGRLWTLDKWEDVINCELIGLVSESGMETGSEEWLICLDYEIRNA